jgi:NitT/TauT family transport system permease protein
LGTAAVLLGVWSLSVRVSETRVFPSPTAVALGIVELARSGLLPRYAADSLFRVAAGFTTALAVGVPLGMAMGLSAATAAVINPVIQFLRPISPLAWIPVAVMIFGISNVATIFLIFLASVLAITVAAMNAARGVPEIYLLAGRNFGLSRAELLTQVIFPAALPELLAGVRIALGVAWLVLVAAEMIAVDSGLGYLIIDARNAGKRYDLVVAGMLLIGVVGFLLDWGVRRIETLRSVRWGFRKR